MPALVRSVQASTVHGPSGTASRGAAQPGDLLLAWQSADSGGHSAIQLSGSWTVLDEYGGGFWPGSGGNNWSGITLWTRTCAAGEPTSYTVSQGSVADGVIVIAAISGAVAASLVVAHSSSKIAPTATPSSADGLELRYCSGVPSPPTGGAVSWSTPSGYTVETAAQSGNFTSGVLVSKPIISTLAVGEVGFASAQIVAAGSFTVLIAASAASGGEPPQPPVVQPFAPGKGSSLYRYVFTRLLDRTYLGDLDLVGVSFDKRILQAGQFSATIPIPSRRVGDQVAEIIPRDETYLDRGPGVITCQIYREGAPWGEYWITAAQPARSRRGTPAIQLRGSTLDAYLAHVEIQSDLPFSAVDQIEIARGLLVHMQGRPHANIGLNLQTGTSGVPRDRTYLASEGGTYGQRLTELAQVDNGFEWSINLEVINGALQRRWVWGYPQLGTLDPPPHLFSDGRNGGDILEWSEEIDALRGATRWRARGESAGDASTTGSSLISTAHEATDHLAAGWPRIDRTLSYSTVSVLQTLEDYAAFWAARASGALRVDQVTVTFGQLPSLTPNNLGDAARLYFNNEWHLPHWRTRRIIGIAITPTSRTDGKEQARLVLEGTEVPGA
ncbi:hypothetical protein [Nonomuraea sediminis]|uniref:hypothetical protein n=1 Tax=Nonomuraea sediminis TaxID=2835864 RepID=UPI001BDDC461|nr:hypothetical protein [Nonomuraea sediminis]